MIPDVNQYLSSIRKTVSEVILPQVSGDPFATEQAALIVVTLTLLLEVQEHQYPYEFAECASLQDTLGDLLKILEQKSAFGSDLQSLVGNVRQQLEQERGVLGLGLPSYKWLRAANEAKRSDLSRLIAWLTAPGHENAWREARSLVDAHIRQQLDHELSWMRKTGFDPAASDHPSIGERIFGSGDVLSVAGLGVAARGTGD
jgi:hypothetical protein